MGGNRLSVVAAAGPPVAWFPLGPREVYVPTYRVSPVYVRAINTPHVVVPTVTINTTTVRYANREVAVTAAPRDVFVRARPVAAAAVVVPREQARAAVVVDRSAARPDRVIVSPAAGVRVAAPPAADMCIASSSDRLRSGPGDAGRQPGSAAARCCPGPGGHARSRASRSSAAGRAAGAATPGASGRSAGNAEAQHTSERGDRGAARAGTAAIDARAQERAQLVAQHQQAERQAGALNATS